MISEPIKMWVVTYGGSDTYYFNDYADMTRAVQGYISSYYEEGTVESETADVVCKELIDQIIKFENKPCVIPIIFDGMQIVISPVVIDSSSDIHRVLCECYNNAQDGSLKQRIASILGVQDAVE